MKAPEQIKQAAADAGAEAVGLAGRERLSGPPSFDPHYLLPGAQAVISLMVSFDPQVVRHYLARSDPRARQRMQQHETELYRRLHHAAGEVARVLRERGHRAAFAEPNLDYRYKEKPAYRAVPAAVRQGVIDKLAKPGARPMARRLRAALLRSMPDAMFAGGSFKLTPSISHRYAALAAGTGVMGFSGNVLHPKHGARVLYHTVVTDAPLSSTPRMEAEACVSCRLCARVCQGGFMHPRQSVRVQVGGRTYSHSQKGHNLRCVFICGGLFGQSKYPGWSTWAEGRIQLAQRDDDLPQQWIDVARQSLGRGGRAAQALADLSSHSEYGFIRQPSDRFAASCGNCQFVCAPRREERVALYRTILGRSA